MKKIHLVLTDYHCEALETCLAIALDDDLIKARLTNEQFQTLTVIKNLVHEKLNPLENTQNPSKQPISFVRPYKPVYDPDNPPKVWPHVEQLNPFERDEEGK